MTSLDLKNIQFRTVGSVPDRMGIFLVNKPINDQRFGTSRQIGELVRLGAVKKGEDRWYLDETYFQDHPGADVRNIISVREYCEIVKSANAQQRSAAVSPDASQEIAQVPSSSGAEATDA
ncbi:hypothetical protein A3F36_03550 [Candidatus Peribacteria bacterium RIFCSPHIGHO2_12_FULL_55_11]|nr:MAG: hypothetical protein A3F36_03550 [Candidatus Peribacteria bacterium RIFCSPHIGHO2_12_FULL_55_11]